MGAESLDKLEPCFHFDLLGLGLWNHWRTSLKTHKKIIQIAERFLKKALAMSPVDRKYGFVGAFKPLQ